MTDEIIALARTLAGATEAEEELLGLLAGAAEQRLTAMLRADVTAETCGGAFLCAAALLTAADLLGTRQGAAEGVERFTAGDISVTRSSSGAGAEALRRQAREIMAPYCAGGGFAFLGVRG